MPHINMKYYSSLDDAKKAELSAALAHAVSDVMGCDEKFVSIAFEPVKKELWHDTVYVPEIINRKTLLVKTPGY